MGLGVSHEEAPSDPSQSSMGCFSSTSAQKVQGPDFTGVADLASPSSAARATSSKDLSASESGRGLQLPIPVKSRVEQAITEADGPGFRPPTAGESLVADADRQLLLKVRLEHSQYFRLPAEAPLHVMVGVVEITDRWLEPNTEVACEIRLFPPRSALTMAFFPETSWVESKVTSTVKGETARSSSRSSRPGTSAWFFGEQVGFSCAEVHEERRADGGLQVQVVILAQPSGERLAATSLFKVPTEAERQEPLWSKGGFTSKQVGQLSVAAGWVGSELMGWLSQEVLHCASFGKWAWVAETLDAMDLPDVKAIGGGSFDAAGRTVLDYAVMSRSGEPQDHLRRVSSGLSELNGEKLATSCNTQSEVAKVFQRLLDAGVSVEEADQEGLTALHYAAFAGSEAAVQSLLAAKSSPDAIAAGGVTPLMLAALAGSLSCSQLLLDAGASVAVLDDQAQTAASWVCSGFQEPPSRSGQKQLINESLEESKAMASIKNGLYEALDRRAQRFVLVGSERRQLLGELVDRLCQAASDLPGSPSGAAAVKRWLPILRDASRPGPVRCGCFSEVYARLRSSQGLHIPLLGGVLQAAIAKGGHGGEQLCRMLLREAGELPVSGKLPSGKSLVEAALDLGWDEVALGLCDRGATLDSDLAAQARALRAAVEGGHTELAKKLVGQWAEGRDSWSRPAAPEAEGLAECPVCFRALCEAGPVVLFNASGRRSCGHFLCSSCAAEVSLQPSPRCPVCRQAFQPPAQRPPDPRDDPAAWFAFFDETGSGYLDRQLLVHVLPAVVPVDATMLEGSLHGALWSEWDPAGEGRVSRKAFCAERGLLRWLAEHLQELSDEEAKGPMPLLEHDREGWFRYWASPGTKEMGKGEVLRAVLKSCGASPLEVSAVAASREWIERCWILWDRDSSGRISLENFCTEGGFADMMLQQSMLATAKRVVRRMELEISDPAALVACCQQLTECAVGIRPEDPVESWPVKACHQLHKRASQTARGEFEEVLQRGFRQVLHVMGRNSGSAKLFAWGCRALAALSFRPPASPGDENATGESAALALEELFSLLNSGVAASAASTRGDEVPAWKFVLQSFSAILQKEQCGPSRTSGGHGTIAPGALREAGLCALGALRALCDCAGADAAEAALEELLSATQRGDTGEAGNASLIAWVAAAIVVLAADGKTLAAMLLKASVVQVESAPNALATLLPNLSGLLLAVANGTAAPARPPTSAKAASGMACKLLSCLRKVPAVARGGAGGGTAQPGGEGGSRAKVTLRDGSVAVGDVVRLCPDVEKTKSLQDPPENFGGWCERMGFCLEFPGRVVEIPRRSPRMPEVLRISHGALGCWCWNAKSVVEVIPDSGLLPFEEDESGPGAALTIGDEVRISVSVEEAKKLQVNHGGWNDRMTQCCGRVGKLEAIDKAGDMKVLVQGVGSFVWNPAALRSLHAQRWELALSERLAGPMEGSLPLALLAALTSLGSRLDEEGLQAVLAELSADDGGFQGWTVLATAALMIDPALASETIEHSAANDDSESAAAENSSSVCNLLRPGLPLAALKGSECSASTAGLQHAAFGDASLSQLLQRWWEELPAWEKRARA
eukprot:TRINITY_DN52290_c0_g1_i1.p1 TRINITY_DN52290_c0_g1~~TRINITY_DN52290_c0_g1_i1.p1  ORF type:complete len:1588 (-),score=364.43 TRINITY_DN52290_c0_g1_i1:5-4768(-)